jgi:hypothetical protein
MSIKWYNSDLLSLLEITCKPLPIVRDGSIYPSACTAGDVAFGTTCSVRCHPGYSLIGPHSKQCLPKGVWAPASDISQCVGKSENHPGHSIHIVQFTSSGNKSHLWYVELTVSWLESLIPRRVSDVKICPTKKDLCRSYQFEIWILVITIGDDKEKQFNFQIKKLRKLHSIKVVPNISKKVYITWNS